MELTEEQVEAAKARGCVFMPLGAAEVAHLSMQRRVFTVGGRSCVATRDGGGFLETHATLVQLIEPQGHGGPNSPRETVRQAEVADAASAREIEGERGAGGAQEMRRPQAAARSTRFQRGGTRGGG